MKSCLWALAAVLCIGHMPLAAAPTVAVVRVTEIYQQQPGVRQAKQKAQQAKEAILSDPRAEELKAGLEQLKVLQSQIDQAAERSMTVDARKLSKAFDLKRIETKSLQEDFENFRKQRSADINRDMVHEMRAILDQIRELCRETAVEKGFDLVIDRSGATNTGLPVVLYVKDAPDITDDVMTRMRELTEKTSSSDGSPEGSGGDSE